MSLNLNFLTNTVSFLTPKNALTAKSNYFLKNRGSQDTFVKETQTDAGVKPSFGRSIKNVLRSAQASNVAVKDAVQLTQACKISEANLKLIQKKLKHGTLSPEKRNFLTKMQRYYNDMIQIACSINPKTLTLCSTIKEGDFKTSWLRFVKLHRVLQTAHRADRGLLPSEITIQSPDILAAFAPDDLVKLPGTSV